MSVRLSCPSCNHAFALPALPADRRAACPRCGDAFAIRTFTEVPDDAPATPAPPAPAGARPARRWRGPDIGTVIGLVVVAGLFWAVYDVARRRLEQANQVPPGGAADVRPPGELGGLGYLRSDSQVVFAVQPGPLLRYAARNGQRPEDVFAQAGLPEPVRGVLGQLPVPPEQLDHLAGGLTFGEGENVLRLTLVLALKEPPADEAAFLRKLQARPFQGDGSRYDAAIGQFGFLLTRVSPTVWAFGLADADFEAADRGGFGPGGVQFRGDERSGLRGVLAEVPADAAVWVAADRERPWTENQILQLVVSRPDQKAWQPVLKAGRGGLLAVTLGPQPRLRLRVRAADDATAARVRDYFAARAAEVPSATAGGDGPVAQFDTPFNAETGKLLQRFLADAGR